jgi:hypothetical protein
LFRRPFKRAVQMSRGRLSECPNQVRVFEIHGPLFRRAIPFHHELIVIQPTSRHAHIRKRHRIGTVLGSANVMEKGHRESMPADMNDAGHTAGRESIAETECVGLEFTHDLFLN